MLSCFRGCVAAGPKATGKHILRETAACPPVAGEDATTKARHSTAAAGSTGSDTGATTGALLRLLPVLASINAGGGGGWCSGLQASCEAVVQGGGLEAAHASVYLVPGGLHGDGGGSSWAFGRRNSSTALQPRLACQVAFAGPSTTPAASSSHAVEMSVTDILFTATAMAPQHPAAPCATPCRLPVLALPLVAFRQAPASAAGGLHARSAAPAAGSAAPQQEWAEAAPASSGVLAPGAAAADRGCSTPVLPLPGDWAHLAEAHGCRQFAVAGIWAGEELVGALAMATTAARRPASWTPEALHAVAAQLTANVTQAVAVLGEALPALLSAGTISQVVAALGGAAAAEAERIAHTSGAVRVAFLHKHPNQQQQQARALSATNALASGATAATAAVFTLDPSAATAVGAGAEGATPVSSSGLQQPPASSAPASLRRRQRPSCEVVMDRDRALLQMLMASRGSEGMQQQRQQHGHNKAPLSEEAGGVGGSSVGGRFSRLSGTQGATDPAAAGGSRRRSPLLLESLPPKALSSVGPRTGEALGGGPGAGPTAGERADSSGGSGLRRMLSFVSAASREAGGGSASGFALQPAAPPCRGHTLPLPGTLLAEALSKGAAGLCVDDCAAHVQDTKAFPRDLVLTRDAPMPLSLALATSAAASDKSSGSFAAGGGGASGGPRFSSDSRRNILVGGSPPATTAGGGGAGGGSHCGCVSGFNASRVSGSDGGYGREYEGGEGGGARGRGAGPVLALYVAFGQPLPMPLLQAVVRSLRELLTAVEPLVATRLMARCGGGLLAEEWRHLQAELQQKTPRAKGGGAASVVDTPIAAAAAAYYCEKEEEAAAAAEAEEAEEAEEESEEESEEEEEDSSGEGAGGLLDTLLCNGELKRALLDTNNNRAADAAATTPHELMARAGGAPPARAAALATSPSGVATGSSEGGASSPRARALVQQLMDAQHQPPSAKPPAAAPAAGGGPPRKSLLRRLLLGGPAAATAAAAAAVPRHAARAQSLPPSPPPLPSALRRQATDLGPCGECGRSQQSQQHDGRDSGSRTLMRTWTTAEEDRGGGGRMSTSADPAWAPTRGGMPVVRSRSSVSFQLEAAESPRGASKLAPVIAVMHERLKSAQAAKMLARAANQCRVQQASRQTDLEALALLQEVGRGGYGVVYRGKYYGSEVAVKVIQEAKCNISAAAAAAAAKGGTLGTRASSSDAAADGAGWGAVADAGGCTADGSGTLHKHNIHDAIELVASVSMAHPNIVQVLTFFTDCRLASGGAAVPARIVSTPSPAADAATAAGPPAAGAAGVEALARKAQGDAPCLVLVMEFCDCGSLSDAIDNGLFLRHLPPAPAAAHTDAASAKKPPLLGISFRAVMLTLLEVALALRHMHSLHLVHCDLKPQNVLLKSNPRDPRGFTAKLSDFGLSKTMAHDDEGQLVIDEALASGTMTHVAPEVFMGERPLGAAVDVYAFGILMVQIVAGVGLYPGLTPQQIAFGVSHEGLRPAFPRWVPRPYRELACKCWHPTAAARPSAEQLVAALQQLGASGSQWAAATPAAQR
ncbi:hypothetical protein HXX76_016037 [Chlamydomonas incerta]|uniref:Protein kinase domain-containing protein n=1 Tax=Chlamydomonas incerta TaxID=51695 RepID=A0A835S7Z1_CHLIN|nr:hypothetical protein HXX76_016037 [Chlamydomonas incerta]|eukprot:KAG2422422.1 hypothetical protein HXX76_016037 [Chlamydomonas incerta]